MWFKGKKIPGLSVKFLTKQGILHLSETFKEVEELFRNIDELVS